MPNKQRKKYNHYEFHVYDYNKMVIDLMETENMTEDEAVEFIDYNTFRSLPYYGHNAPIVLINGEEYV